MTASIRQGLFIILAVASLLTTWPHAFAWIAKGGNIANPFQFFIDAYRSGSAAAFLTIDILVAWIAFMVWVVHDTRRIGLGVRWGWFFVGLSYLGTCFAFPIYLVTRERFLARQTSVQHRPATA